MEKFRHLSFTSIRDSFERVRSGNMNPDLAWDIILGVTAVLALLIGATAYTTLSWAEAVGVADSRPQKKGDTLSPEDLHAVVEIYNTKASAYKALLQSRPDAPNLKMSISASSSLVSTTTEVSIAPNSIPPRPTRN